MGIARQERMDLAQEVIRQALRTWHTFDPNHGTSGPKTAFARWLYSNARHVRAHELDKARHRREELRAEPMDEEVPDAAPVPHDELEREQAREAMLALLATLPIDVRAVVVAHDIDGEPMEDLAEMRGIPLTTIYKWRARAIEHLKDRPSSGAELEAWLTARRAWRDR